MKKTIIYFVSVLFCLNAFSTNIPPGTKLYLSPGVWEIAGTRYAAYFFEGSSDAWVSMTLVENENMYEVTTPTGTWNNLIFCRMNGSTTENTWTNKWNQTNDLTYDETNNLFSITGWGELGKESPGTWSYYSPTPIITDPIVSLVIPSVAYSGYEIAFSANSQNVENPVFKFAVKSPNESNYSEISSPYTPETTGAYSFKVEVATTSEPDKILATDEKEVLIKEFSNSGITIGVKIPDDWDMVSFYYWATGLEGSFVQPVYQDDFYVYSFDGLDEVNLIFVNGTAFPEGTSANDEAKLRLGKQSINLEEIDESRCFEIVAATYDDGDPDWGKRRVNSSECPFEIEDENYLVTVEQNTFIHVENNLLKVNIDGAAQIELFTVSGQIIRSQQIESQFNLYLNSGAYLLRLNGKTHKILIL